MCIAYSYHRRLNGHEGRIQSLGRLWRLVVPLWPPDQAPQAAKRLNPVFMIDEEKVVMYTQFASSVATRDLGAPVQSIADQHTTIMNAFDMLLVGY